MSTEQATRPDEYVFVNPVWGDAYVERFLKMSLPAQLSAGNIQAMPADRTRYLIYTLKKHFRRISESDSFRRLEELIPVSLLSLDDLPDPRTNNSPHELQTAAYGRGIRHMRGKNAAFIFLTPDLLASDGSFAKLVDLCEQDRKRVVVVASIRMCVDGAIECIDSHRTDRPGEVSIPPRELVQHCLDDIHPISAAHIVRKRGVMAAAHFYWQIDDSGLLIQGFHLFPFLVWPESNAAIRNTLDDDYVGRACPNRNDWCTVTDSDDVCVVEFSERNHKPGMVAPDYLTEADMLRFMEHGTNAEHREMVKTPICFHANPIEPAAWDPVRAEAAGFVSNLLTRFRHPQMECHPAPLPSNTSAKKSLLRAIASPIRKIYRTLLWPLYRYLDLLNSQVMDLRNEISVMKDERDRMKYRVEGMEAYAKKLRRLLVREKRRNQFRV